LILTFFLEDSFPVSPDETEIFGKDIDLPCIIDWNEETEDAGNSMIREQEVINAASKAVDHAWLEK
jgi:hypothetical protein